MRISARRLGLLAAAIVFGGMAWFAPPPDSGEVALPVDRDRQGPESAAARPNPRLGALPERAAIGEPAGELFGPQSWAPPTAAAAPAASAEPVVPPNPYSVAGSMLIDGTPSVYLAKGERIFEARPGLELDGGYRVESIAADHVLLVYAPLDARVVLPFNSSLVAQGGLPTSVSAVAPPAAPNGPPGPAKPAQLRWEGPASVRAGATFSVALHVSSERALRASPMQLRFAPDLLEPLTVRAGKFFGQGSFSYRMNSDGTIFVGAAGRGASPGADAELVVVTFRPRRAGATAEVSLGSLALEGAAGQALPHDAVSAFRTAIQ